MLHGVVDIIDSALAFGGFHTTKNKVPKAL